MSHQLTFADSEFSSKRRQFTLIQECTMNGGPMKRFSLAILALVVATGAQAASEKVEMNLVTSQGVGQSIGRHAGP